MSRLRSIPPPSVIDRLTDIAFPTAAPDYSEMMVALDENPESSALVETLFNSINMRFHNAWSTDRRIRAFETIQKALPDQLKTLNVRLSDADDNYAEARAEASYLLGIEIGKRLQQLASGRRA